MLLNCFLCWEKKKIVMLQCQRGSTDWQVVGSLQHYHLNKSDFSLPDNHRDLGVLLDNTLKFRAYIQTTADKVAALTNNILVSTLWLQWLYCGLYSSATQPLLEDLGDLQLLESVLDL